MIYLILDKPNVDADRQLAKHLVSLYYPKEDRLEIDGSLYVCMYVCMYDTCYLKLTTCSAEDLLGLPENILNPNGLVSQKFLRDFIAYARYSMHTHTYIHTYIHTYYTDTYTSRYS